jgi:hypothetical protein
MCIIIMYIYMYTYTIYTTYNILLILLSTLSVSVWAVVGLCWYSISLDPSQSRKAPLCGSSQILLSKVAGAVAHGAIFRFKGNQQETPSAGPSNVGAVLAAPQLSRSCSKMVSTSS